MGRQKRCCMALPHVLRETYLSLYVLRETVLSLLIRKQLKSHASLKRMTDHRAGPPERHHSHADTQQGGKPQVLWLADADAHVLWPQEPGCSAAAVHSDGQCQVQLRLWVLGCPGQAGADTTHWPVLPHHDTGSGSQAGWITFWYAAVSDHKVTVLDLFEGVIWWQHSWVVFMIYLLGWKGTVWSDSIFCCCLHHFLDKHCTEQL